jgi:hypothetical protein
LLLRGRFQFRAHRCIISASCFATRLFILHECAAYSFNK